MSEGARAVGVGVGEGGGGRGVEGGVGGPEAGAEVRVGAVGPRRREGDSRCVQVADSWREQHGGGGGEVVVGGEGGGGQVKGGNCPG